MNIDEIIQQLRSERERIDQALSALESGSTASGRRDRRFKANKAQPKPAGKRRGRPAMTAAEKKRLSVQMKKRWAERKAAAAKAEKAKQ